MKKLILTIIIAVLSISVCVISIIYINQVAIKSEAYINEIQSYMIKNEPKFALKEVGTLKRFWEDNHDILSTILHHEMLEEIEESIHVMESSIQHYDKENADFWLESTKSLVKIKNLKECEMPSFANIL